MSEVLTWTVGVFLVLAGPTLLIVVAELRRRRERRDRQGADDSASGPLTQ
jgi:hypothetical protein